jgi:hypothetical protein
MKHTVRLIIMSHLSDVQDWPNQPENDQNNHKINFVKYLLMKYSNTNIEIDAEVEYNLFKEKHPNL